MIANVASIVVGLWLMFSPAVLRHADNSGLNVWVVGLAVVTTAALSIWMRPFRYVNTALGLWLVASVLFTGYHSRLLMAHDGLLGLLVVVLSGIPGRALRSAANTSVLGPADHPYAHLQQPRKAEYDEISV